MHFIQIIYCNNKPLVLTSDHKYFKTIHPEGKDYPVFAGNTAENVADALATVAQLEYEGAVIENVSHEAVLQELHKLYVPIDAGGGVVTNENDEILMIFRRGKWDLPKGKRDKGETMDECALREVSEETGLQKVKLGEKICDTYHIYNMYGKNQLKHTAWYQMHTKSTEILQPQAEEDIEEVRWVSPNDLAPLLATTYEAIREVLRKAGYKW